MKRPTKYNTGGQTPWMGLAKQAPQLMDAIIGLFENNPNAYSKQPTLNADTMRQMVTPYAYGGMVDEEQLAQLQAMADQYGLSLEELLAELQNAGTDQAEAEVEDESIIPVDEEEEDITDQFAYGGKVKKKKYAMGGAPIEVEGGEVIETPDGDLSKIKGPSHEAGGIDINVPPGTKIFSDRLKIDGKTMQERKVRREKALSRIEKMLNTNPTDKITKGSYDRTLEVNQAEEMKDMALQKMMNAIYNAGQQPQEEFAYGGTAKGSYAFGGDPWSEYLKSLMNPSPVGQVPYSIGNEPIPKGQVVSGSPLGTDPWSKYLGSLMEDKPVNIPFLPGQRNTGVPSTVSGVPNSSAIESTGLNLPTVTGRTAQNLGGINVPDLPDEDETNKGFTGNLSAGDWVGLGGNLFNAIAPLVNTQNMASNMKPNVNRYLGFGKDALDNNLQAQNAIQSSRSSQLDDIETQANSARARARNSASGINTIRALDTVTEMQTGKARQGAYDSFNNAMMNLLGQRAQLENMQDRFEMAGATQRDIEDKADMDNYYSNMAQNLVNFGSNIQGVGRALNINKSNKIDARLLSQLSQYGLGIDDDGNLISQ